MFRSLFNFLFGKKRQQPDFIAPELHSIPVELEESVFAAGEPLYDSVYPHDWERIRREVLNRDGGHCQVTGCLNYYRSPSDFYDVSVRDEKHKG